MRKTVIVIIAVAVVVGLFAQRASAGYIVTGAKIIKIANTANNQDYFSVLISGGTGPCATMWVAFPQSAAATQKILDRAFALAMSAMTAGYVVSIYNYQSDSCDKAAYIEVSPN
jgi:hypothetical protein